MARTPRKTATKEPVVAAAAVSPKPEPVALGSVDPEKQYHVKINRNVKVGSAMLRPFDNNIVKGKHIAGMGDAVVSIEER